MPVFNAEGTILRALESLKKIPESSRPLVEVVIIDDCSPDKSLTVVEKNLFPGFSWMILKQEKNNLIAARNRGLSEAKGQWIMFLDADDELGSDPIPFLDENCTAIGFKIKFLKESGLSFNWQSVLIKPENFWEIFTAENPFTISSLIFKKEKMSALFNPDFLFLEDWFFWISSPSFFERMAVVNETSAIIHLHSAGRSARTLEMGGCRSRIAKKVLSDFDQKLTKKQKNNLLIQMAVGDLQQGKKVKLDQVLFLWPCNFKLYFKLLIYLFSKGQVRV